MNDSPLHRLARLVGGEVYGVSVLVGRHTISCEPNGGIWLAGKGLDPTKIGTFSDGPETIAAAYQARTTGRAA